MDNRIDAVYARQSVDKKDSISIESQIDFCKYELKGGSCKEYTDKGYSGKNTDRPHFQELVRDIEKGLVNSPSVPSNAISLMYTGSSIPSATPNNSFSIDNHLGYQFTIFLLPIQFSEEPDKTADENRKAPACRRSGRRGASHAGNYTVRLGG